MRLDHSPSSEQNDFLAWLIDESQGEDREDWPIAARIFNLNFAAIHTSSMVSLAMHHVVNIESLLFRP